MPTGGPVAGSGRAFSTEHNSLASTQRHPDPSLEMPSAKSQHPASRVLSVQPLRGGGREGSRRGNGRCPTPELPSQASIPIGRQREKLCETRATKAAEWGMGENELWPWGLGSRA